MVSQGERSTLAEPRLRTKLMESHRKVGHVRRFTEIEMSSPPALAMTSTSPWDIKSKYHVRPTRLGGKRNVNVLLAEEVTSAPLFR